MMYYDEFSVLSQDDLNKKISKLINMRKHYSIYKQMHMTETIDNMLETCYYIADERISKVHDDQILKTTGVIIDTQQSLEETKKQDNDEQTPRTKRRRIAIV